MLFRSRHIKSLRLTPSQFDVIATLGDTEGIEAGPSLDGARSLELGLAGERPGAPIKCLHAHVAVALACPRYAFGELARARAGTAERRECCAWT